LIGIIWKQALAMTLRSDARELLGGPVRGEGGAKKHTQQAIEIS
jgi:hypothetical protein